MFISAATPFFAWMLVVSVVDLLSRRISNYMILFGAAYCLGIAWFSVGPISFGASLLGAIVGVALFILPYAKGLIGAGDVKLIGVVGLFMGPILTLSSILYASVMGGICAALYLISKGLLHKTVGNVMGLGISGARIPYAFAISLGALWAFLNPNFL